MDDKKTNSEDTADAGNSTDSETEEIPKAWVKDFFEREEYIKQKLDEAQESYFRQENEKIKEILRNIYEYNQNIYKTLLYSISQNEGFLSDVSDQMGDEAAERLTDLQRFDDIVKSMAYVLSEKNGRKNIFTSGVISEPLYQTNQNTVIIPYTVESGGSELIRIRGDPEDHLHASVLMSEAAEAGLEETVSEGLRLKQSEIEDVKRELKKLNQITDNIFEHLENIDTVEEESDPVGDEI